MNRARRHVGRIASLSIALVALALGSWGGVNAQAKSPVAACVAVAEPVTIVGTQACNTQRTSIPTFHYQVIGVVPHWFARVCDNNLCIYRWFYNAPTKGSITMPACAGGCIGSISLTVRPAVGIGYIYAAP